MGYNKTILEGHLTRDIEMKYTQSGSAIASTAIATSRKFKAADGTPKEEVLFIDITFFGRTAEIANQFLRKGSHVLIDGRLKLDQWTAQDGTKRSKHQVTVESLTMLDKKEDSQGQAPQGQPAPQGGYGQPSPQPGAYGQPTAGQQAPQPGYNQPAPQPAYNHQGQSGYAQPQPQPQQAQPAAQQPAGQPGQPQIIGYAPNGAPIYAQPGQQPTNSPAGQINEDEIPF